jgi:multidrug efflux pump subunit AcrB
MLMIDGSTGEYAFSLPMVVIILLLSSWFLSMYMTPAMCFWFMKVKPPDKNSKQPPESADQPDNDKAEDAYSGSFYRIYRRILERMLYLRLIVLPVAVGVIFVGGFIASLLVREFFGPSDRNQFLIYVDLPAGYRIEATDDIVKRLTSWLSDKGKNPEVTSTIAYVGTGGPRFFLVLSPLDPDSWLSIQRPATRCPTWSSACGRIFYLPSRKPRVVSNRCGWAQPNPVSLKYVFMAWILTIFSKRAANWWRA